MARDIYDWGAIFCVGLPVIGGVAFIGNTFSFPGWLILVLIIVTVCAFNFVWASVKPRITGKPPKYYQQFPQQQTVIQPIFTPQATQTTLTTPINPTTYQYSPSGTIAPSLKICPNCQNAELDSVKFCRKCGHVL
jgi:preprotein translocase subunit SecY